MDELTPICQMKDLPLGGSTTCRRESLLSSSLYALKHYITLCEDYANRFNILFNPIKTKLMCFNVKHKDFALYVCNQPVNLVEHETYFGNYIVSDIFDRGISHTEQTFYTKKGIMSFQMLEC